MRADVIKETVEGYVGECECGYCGAPIETGEALYYYKADEYGPAFCSIRCLESLEKMQEVNA